MMVNTLLFCFSSILSTLAAAETFDNPPGAAPEKNYTFNQVWLLGSIQTICWETNLEEYSLKLWQRLGDSQYYASDPIYTKRKEDEELGQMFWTVQTYNFNLSDHNVFRFGINGDGPHKGGFDSHYFNITQDPSKAVNGSPAITYISPGIDGEASNESYKPTNTASGTAKPTLPNNTQTPSGFIKQNTKSSAHLWPSQIALIVICSILLLVAVVGFIFLMNRKRSQKAQLKPKPTKYVIGSPFNFRHNPSPYGRPLCELVARPVRPGLEQNDRERSIA